MTDLNQNIFPDLKVHKQRTRRLQFILLAVAAVLAVGITWVSLASYKNYEQETRTHLEQQLSSIVSLKSFDLAVWYRERHGDAEMLKNSPALPMLIYNLIHNPSDQNSPAKLKRYLESLTESYGYESYLVTDASGIVLLSFPEAADLEHVYEHAEEITKAFKTGQIVFFDFHTHAEETAEKIFLSLIIPIFDEEITSQPLGAIILIINPEDYLYPLITNWPVPSNTAETLLIRPENDHILFLNPLRFNPGAALSLTVCKLAAEIVPSLQEIEPDRKVEILITADLTAKGDPHLLQVVLNNLIGNAWKFSSQEAQAKIEVGRAVIDGENVFFVRDNGVGFNMAYADKLFGAFQRLHGVNEFPGTGVGLATVQRIINRHGGRIWAESEVGKGATFFFTLPG